MSNELVKHTGQSLAEMERIASFFARSGYFSDARELSQAFVKIQAGHELGFAPMASMTGIAIIQNKPVVGANLMASRIRMSGYNYEVRELTEKRCEIDFYDTEKKLLGTSVFTMEDAGRIGLSGKDNWKKYPKNMLFARSISNGIKWYCPEVMQGQTVYTPDELGGDVDEDGNPIVPVNAEYKIEQPALPADIAFGDILDDANKPADEIPMSEAQRKCLYATNTANAKLTHEQLIWVAENKIGHELMTDPKDQKKHLSSMTSSETSIVIEALKDGGYIETILRCIKHEEVKVDKEKLKEIGNIIKDLMGGDKEKSARLLYGLTGYSELKKIPPNQLHNTLVNTMTLTKDTPMVQEILNPKKTDWESPLEEEIHKETGKIKKEVLYGALNDDDIPF